MDDLSPPWRDYRRRWNTVTVALAAGIPLGLCAAALDRLAGGGDAHHVLLAGWATGSIAAVAWLLSFPCPYCGAAFHWTLWVTNPFSRTCLHCGFRKWKDPAAAARLRAPGP